MVCKVWADYGPEFDPEYPENPNENCFTLAVDAEEYEELEARLAEYEAKDGQRTREHNLLVRENREQAVRLGEADALLREIHDRPRHCREGAYDVRMYVGDYERIDAHLSAEVNHSGRIPPQSSAMVDSAEGERE